jgi:hypothetical protein
VPGVKPHSTGMMDCNGHSPKYHDVKVDLGGGCTDPRGTWGGRFEDNGTYVGHDEPSVKFISRAPGSGNNMSYLMRLPRDPKGKPTVSPNGKTVSDYAELSPPRGLGCRSATPAPIRRTPARRTATPTAGPSTTPTPRARRSWRFSSIRLGISRSSIRPAATRLIGARHSPSTAWNPSSTSSDSTRIARNRPTSPSCSAMACRPGRPARSWLM